MREGDFNQPSRILENINKKKIYLVFNYHLVGCSAARHVNPQEIDAWSHIAHIHKIGSVACHELPGSVDEFNPVDKAIGASHDIVARRHRANLDKRLAGRD